MVWWMISVALITGAGRRQSSGTSFSGKQGRHSDIGARAIGLLDKLLRHDKNQVPTQDIAVKELSEFLECLRKIDEVALGMVAAQVTDVAWRIASDSDFKINLRNPKEALLLYPRLL
jgi:hypothetical protein